MIAGVRGQHVPYTVRRRPSMILSAGSVDIHVDKSRRLARAGEWRQVAAHCSRQPQAHGLVAQRADVCRVAAGFESEAFYAVVRAA